MISLEKEITKEVDYSVLTVRKVLQVEKKIYLEIQVKIQIIKILENIYLADLNILKLISILLTIEEQIYIVDLFYFKENSIFLIDKMANKILDS